MDLNSIILFFFLIGFNLIFYKYFLTIISSLNPKILIDDEFNKLNFFENFMSLINISISSLKRYGFK